MASILGQRNQVCSFKLGDNEDLAGLTKITIIKPQDFVKLLGITGAQSVQQAFKDNKFINLGFEFCKETLVLEYNPEEKSGLKIKNKRNRPVKYHPYKKVEESLTLPPLYLDSNTECLHMNSEGGISIDVLLNQLPRIF